MKKFGVFLFVFAVFFSYAVVISAQEEAADAAAATEESATTEEAAEIPGSVDMTLEMKPGKFVMPANFRGGDPDRGAKRTCGIADTGLRAMGRSRPDHAFPRRCQLHDSGRCRLHGI